eukprot:GHVT01097184.1.p1 GENE.GHVT01097184.1~~GHVT01097184.1.p1  ORF type:complete len:231 (-),score=11.14 GHVT01097184.1:255-947(-)
MCSRSAFLHCRLPLPLLSSWASTVSCRVSRLLCLSTGFRRGVGIGRGVCTYSPTPSSAPGKVPVFPAGTGGRRGAHVPSESYDKEGGQVERMSRGFGGGAGIMPPESFQEAASGQVHRVVTSFLLHPTDQVPPGSGNRRVLVARRSNQVSTFKVRILPPPSIVVATPLLPSFTDRFGRPFAHSSSMATNLCTFIYTVHVPAILLPIPILPFVAYVRRFCTHYSFRFFLSS